MDKFLGKLFGSGQRATPDPDFPNLKFGRYNDFTKSPVQRGHLRSAESSFANGDFLSSVEQFLLYINDPSLQNVKFNRTIDKLEFRLHQGSNLVRGRATKDGLEAEAEIAIFEQAHVVVMRKLLELNFGLKYARYAFSENTIVLRMRCSSADCNPDKLYHALKEIATRGDKLDDLLLDEFGSLKKSSDAELEEIPLSEKELKFHFFKHWIRDTLSSLPTTDRKKYANFISYALLNLAYKIDYLVTPEGRLMDRLEKIHHHYYGSDMSSMEEKNERTIKEFESILTMTRDDFFKEIYRVKASFGLGSRVDASTVAEFVKKGLSNLHLELFEYPYNLRKHKLEYIAQYGLFHYRMNVPCSEFFHLAVELCNQDYFTAIGHDPLIDAENGRLNQAMIRDRIRAIEIKSKPTFPLLALQSRKLDFDELLSFLEGYYYQLAEVNFQMNRKTV